MKIGIDIRTLMDTHYSGVSEYTLNLLEAIFKLDKKNEYKLFYNSGKDVSSQIPQFAYDNVTVVSTRYPNKIFNNLMQRIWRRPKIDQLLGVDLFFMPNIGFIALSARCKKIITIHDLSYWRYPEFFSVKRRLWHKLIGAKELLRNFDMVLAVSENTKQDIVELGHIASEKVQVIYSGLGAQYHQIKNDIEKRNLALVQKKYQLPQKFILYLSTIEPRKNVSGIIKAFEEFILENAEMKNFGLVIAGAWGWKSKEVFKTWQASRHKAKIKFLGYVDQGDKVYLYNLASLFVYPSFYEGFGFPPLEAMACGCPVITSTVSSLPEIAGQAALMVNPDNIREITQAMSLIMQDAHLRDSLVKKALETVQGFVWENAAKSYLQLFKRLDIL
jgi:glycosyltransferase involved in cell wall biosynthesis